MENVLLPLVRENIIFLDSKSIDVNQCNLEDARKFFGVEQKREVLSKNKRGVAERLIFEHHNFDRIEAAMLTNEVAGQLICGFEFFFHEVILLRELLPVYGEPELVKIRFPDGMAVYAIWSINLAAEILKDGSIKSLEFCNEKHLKECECNFCVTVKKTSAHLRPGKEKIVLQ